MKRIMLLLAVLIGVFTASACDTYLHDIFSLPASAQTIVKNNFKAAVSHIKVDKDGSSAVSVTQTLQDMV